MQYSATNGSHASGVNVRVGTIAVSVAEGTAIVDVGSSVMNVGMLVGMLGGVGADVQEDNNTNPRNNDRVIRPYMESASSAVAPWRHLLADCKEAVDFL